MKECKNKLAKEMYYVKNEERIDVRDKPYAKTQKGKESIAKASNKWRKRNPLFRVWYDMVNRCTNKNNKYYYRYGGRGISVCNRWLKSRDLFIEDMIYGYKKGLQINRVDNDGDYSPENCKWSTPQENSRNQENSKYWFIDGVRYETAKEAGAAHGVSGSSASAWCIGYYKYGRYHSPRSNCFSKLRSEC